MAKEFVLLGDLTSENAGGYWSKPTEVRTSSFNNEKARQKEVEDEKKKKARRSK